MQTLNIGRDATNNIVLNDNFVSRNHAQLILLDNGQVLIKDLSSSNGTFVNGNKINECYLKPGDVIKCASVNLNWQAYSYRTLSNQNQEYKIQNISRIVNKSPKRTYLISTYVVIAFLFFLPFCDIKCGGQKVATLTGTDLKIGKEIPNPSQDAFSFDKKPENNKKEKADPNPFIIAAFLSSILGLIILITKHKNQFKVSFFGGLAGFVSLIIFIFQIENKITEGTSIEYSIPFWLTLIFFLIASILSYIEGYQNNINVIT